MEWVLDKKRPICPQICEQLCLKISNGSFTANERLPSVREIALTAGVNPNTVQHSFEELEHKEILYSVRGSGWFVGEDISKAKEVIKNLYNEKTERFFSEMEALGLKHDEIKKYVEEWNI